MIELAGFALLRPAWTLACPVAILGFLLLRASKGGSGWERAIDPHLMAALGRLGNVIPGTRRRHALPALTALLVALALVGPAREKDGAPAYRNLEGIVLAVDLSRSVAESGHLPQALTAARLVAERAGSRPVALVAYAGDAYLASPLTTDIRALGTTIALLDGETVPDPGSRPERALTLAREVLEGARIVGGDVVLVSDGGGLGESALREARAIAQGGGRVSVLHVEAAGGPRRTGDALQPLLAAGHGYSASVMDPLAIADGIAARSGDRLIASDLALLAFTDYGRALLVLALLPAFGLFRRRTAI